MIIFFTCGVLLYVVDIAEIASYQISYFTKKKLQSKTFYILSSTVQGPIDKYILEIVSFKISLCTEGYVKIRST